MSYPSTVFQSRGIEDFIMKINLTALVSLGLLAFTLADESLFRSLERQSKNLHYKSLATSGNGCTPKNVAVRREW